MKAHKQILRINVGIFYIYSIKIDFVWHKNN